jgi:hypothetical protein
VEADRVLLASLFSKLKKTVYSATSSAISKAASGFRRRRPDLKRNPVVFYLTHRQIRTSNFSDALRIPSIIR